MFRCLLSADIHRVGFISWPLAVYRKQTLSTAVHITYRRRNNLGYVCLFVYLLRHGQSETKFRQLTVVCCLKWCISRTGHHTAPLTQTRRWREETEWVGGKPPLDTALECEVDDTWTSWWYIKPNTTLKVIVRRLGSLELFNSPHLSWTCCEIPGDVEVGFMK